VNEVEPPHSLAESVFVDWLLRRECASEESIERLLERHPALASELERMHRDWLDFEPLVRGMVPGTLVEAPGWTLPGAGGAGASEPSAVAALERLGVGAQDHERYHFLALLGRGGGGMVFKVWDRRLRRLLALKFVHAHSTLPNCSDSPGYDPRALRRFINEARVASQLAHPGIVPVHDVGADRDGRAYYTMKLVEGVSLLEAFARYRAADREWTLARLVEAIARVCDTMAYAHARGVLHRDLKSANVMIGPYGEVYVVDWGLARVQDVATEPAPAASDPWSQWLGGLTTNAGAAADTPHGQSAAGDVLGTPGYMAPEQARGEISAVGPRTDVYAVGAMLYELLAGRAPYSEELKGTPPSEWLQRIRSSAPMPLELATPKAYPELAAICEKAMEHDSARRYESMRELAAELRAFLDGRVVQAHDIGAWAHVAKWVRRNRALAGALAALVVALLTGSSIVGAKNIELSNAEATILGRNRELEERTREAQLAAQAAEERRAEAEREREATRAAFERAEVSKKQTQQVVDFQHGMFRELELARFGRAMDQALMTNLRGLDPTVRPSDEQLQLVEDALGLSNDADVARDVLEEQMFEPVLQRTFAEFTSQPELAASLRIRLARVWSEMNLYAIAERAARAALAARLEIFGAEHDEVAYAQSILGAVLTELERDKEASALLEQALAQFERTRGADDTDLAVTRGSLSNLRLRQRRYREAEELALAALQSLERARGPDHIDTTAVAANYAFALRMQGRLSEAEPVARNVLERRERQWGESAPKTLHALNNLGMLLKDMGRLNEAVEVYRRALAGWRSTVGEHDPRTVLTRNNLASALHDLRQLDEALALYNESLESAKRMGANGTSLALHLMGNIGLLHKHAGRLEQAEELYRKVIELTTEAFGPTDQRALNARHNLAMLHAARKQYDDAIALMGELLAQIEAMGAGDSRDAADSRSALAGILWDAGRVDEAVATYERVIEWRSATLGERNLATCLAAARLAQVLTHKENFARAVELFGPALEVMRKEYGRTHEYVVHPAMTHARALEGLGEFEAAERALLELEQDFERATPPLPGQARGVRGERRELLRRWQRASPSEARARELEQLDELLGRR
jgi:tetratricopeptide (TPR) repeat protein